MPLGLVVKKASNSRAIISKIYALARVTDRDMHAPRFALSRADFHLAPAVIVLTYRFERVQNEIHQGLNKLGLVADHGRERSWQVEAHSDPIEFRFGSDDATGVMHNLPQDQSKTSRLHRVERSL
jgi:hypothetical protein